MKRLILVILVVALLIAGVVPQTVYADDGEKIREQERWLNDEEKAYVAKMRQTYATARGAIGALQVCIWKSDLAVQGDKEWNSTFNGNLAALKAAGNVFCQGKAPESMKTMDKVHANLCELCSKLPGSINMESALLVKGPLLVIFALEAQNRNLENIEVGIDVAEGMLNDCIAEIAEKGEKQAEAAEEIDILRQFRDEFLLHNPPGRAFVAIYYEVSPPIAEFISEHEVVRMVVREGFVDPVVAVVESTQGWWAE